MKEKLIIIGAGGHSKSVADCVDTDAYQIVGFFDDNKTGEHMGYPILSGNLTDIEDYRSCKYFVAIGDNFARKAWFERLGQLGLETINIIDKTAIVSTSAKIGTGNFIGKFTTINADVTIGNNNIINTKALVEHECVVGSHNHLSTISVINGCVVVGDCVFFGSSSVCVGYKKLGDNSTIGAGSVIIKDVEPDVTVVGVPGRIVKRRKS